MQLTRNWHGPPNQTTILMEVQKVEQQLKALLHEFQRQWAAGPETADRSLLEQSKQLLPELLNRESLDADQVRTAMDLYSLLGDLAGIVSLLRRYLGQPLPTAEEAWARWHLIDHLALLRRCDEAVSSQREYLAWARRILPQPTWMLPPKWPFGDDGTRNRTAAPADERLLIRVMYDATQAFCWEAVGKTDEWLGIFNDILAITPATPRNRADRRYLLRTASALMKKAHRSQAALQTAERLRALIDEDPAWDEALEVDIDAKCMQIEAYGDLQNVLEVRRVGMEATALLEDHAREQESPSQEIQEILYHNTAAALYASRQYDLAIPLFRRAIELKSTVPYAYLWLAASLWATTKDRAQVLPLLEKARLLRLSDPLPLQKAPEFEDVAEDAEFRGLFSRETR